jgi:PTH1 family peptidyl-tRNA hydrolase
MRLGVGAPDTGGDWSEYVLAGFGDDGRPVVEAMIERAREAVETVVREGLEPAMNRFNRRNPAAGNAGSDP